MGILGHGPIPAHPTAIPAFLGVPDEVQSVKKVDFVGSES